MPFLRNLVCATRGMRTPLRLALAGAAVLIGLAACGGGDPVSDFEPERMLVLGDETSLLTDDGRKYSVNGLGPVPPGGAASAPIDCRAERIWIQRLADEFGFSFEECNSNPPQTPPRAIIYATVGARVADIATQVATHEATSSFTPRDLVTVLVGQHDLIGLYERIAMGGATTAGQCSAAEGEARATGAALAAQINRIARGGSGGRVLFVTVPRQGDTPFGRQTAPDANRRQCLNQLTDAFNTGLRTDVTNDGRHMALVAIDEQARLIVGDADRFGYENVSEAACLATAPLPDCRTDTLVAPATSGDYLWADDRHFGPQLHDLLGDLAADRVTNDVPF